MDDVYQLALETIQLNKQAIIFAASRANAEKTAEEISKLTHFSHPELEQEILKAGSTPTRQCRRLSHCVKKGIAFHHAGLLSKQRELIEDEFRAGKIKIICATPTLAAGLYTPAYRVIIPSLKRFSGQWGMDWIPVLEYLQMAGRAGRPEFEKEGQAISLAKTEAEKEGIYERYILGEPEDIYSKLAVEPVLRTYLLSLISSGVIRDKKSMMSFFSKTFWAQQFQDMDKLQQIMERMILLLEKWEFITVPASADFVAATEMANEKILRPTLLGKRVSELYLDPLTAHHFLSCLQNYSEKNNHFPLLQMICHTLELRPLLRVKAKEQDKIQEELVKRYDLLLEQEPSAFDVEYDDFFSSIKTALFLEAWMNEGDEDFLLETFDIRPGEIRVKLETADWLLYAVDELAKIKQLREISKQASLLRLRIKEGIKEELLPLLKLRGIARIRGRKLFNAGIKDLGDIKKVDLTTLSQLVGKAVAEDIKKQVGEEIEEVPAGRRKGQGSLKRIEY